MKQDAIKLDIMRREIDRSKDPEALLRMEGELDSFERYLKASGLLEELCPVRELRMRARWRLGGLLAEIAPGHGPGRGKKGAGERHLLLNGFDLAHQRVTDLERLGRLPAPDLERAFAEAREDQTLITQRALIVLARPYWYKANREARHLEIVASFDPANGVTGPFPLIYADPPWKFNTYSEKGLERTPDQKYPTLSDQQIHDFAINGVPMPDVAAKTAALLLWCTSSNLPRALWIMEGWGFKFKSSAAWVKTKGDGKLALGLGLVFRNAHELLLYGTRGDMPGPQYQPPSVFMYPRRRHSEKPAEVRKAVERMYPNFNAKTRLELFSRTDVKGWTHYGLEA